MNISNNNFDDHDPNIEFLFGEDSESALNFKPITEGLGFHGQKNEKKYINRSVSKKTDYVRSPELKKETNPVVSELSSLSKESLSALYGIDEEKISTKTKKIKTVKTKKATSLEMSMAFALDLFLIVLASISILSLLIFSQNISPEIILNKKFIAFSYPYVLALFSFSFVFYFLVMEVNQTIGKKLLGIKLYSDLNEKVSLTQILIRSLVVLFSIPLLFLPLILRFHDLLSDTRIVKQGE